MAFITKLRISLVLALAVSSGYAQEIQKILRRSQDAVG